MSIKAKKNINPYKNVSLGRDLNTGMIPETWYTYLHASTHHPYICCSRTTLCTSSTFFPPHWLIPRQLLSLPISRLK